MRALKLVAILLVTAGLISCSVPPETKKTSNGTRSELTKASERKCLQEGFFIVTPLKKECVTYEDEANVQCSDNLAEPGSEKSFIPAPSAAETKFSALCKQGGGDIVFTTHECKKTPPFCTVAVTDFPSFANGYEQCTSEGFTLESPSVKECISSITWESFRMDNQENPGADNGSDEIDSCSNVKCAGSDLFTKAQEKFETQCKEAQGVFGALPDSSRLSYHPDSHVGCCGDSGPQFVYCSVTPRETSAPLPLKDCALDGYFIATPQTRDCLTLNSELVSTGPDCDEGISDLSTNQISVRDFETSCKESGGTILYPTHLCKATIPPFCSVPVDHDMTQKSLESQKGYEHCVVEGYGEDSPTEKKCLSSVLWTQYRSSSNSKSRDCSRIRCAGPDLLSFQQEDFKNFCLKEGGSFLELMETGRIQDDPHHSSCCSDAGPRFVGCSVPVENVSKPD